MSQLDYMDRILESTPRLTADKLKNEPAVKLCEIVLSGLREECDKIVTYPSPNSVSEMINVFSSKFYQGISMGKGDIAKANFLSKLRANGYDIG